MNKKSSPKICVVLGTRPEIIKLSPLIRLLEDKKANYFIVHSDQHYSFNMDTLFFKDLDLPKPHYQLRISGRRSIAPAEQFAKMMIGMEKIFNKEKPRYVLVQGDTNTVLAGALTANRLSYTSHFKGWKIAIGHVEAGLRSRDLRMPEEMNRLLADRMSDVLYVPTANSAKNVISEGIAKEKILISGNTVVDAVKQNCLIAKKKSKILKDLNVKKNTFGLLTLHRPENVDHKMMLKRILHGVNEVGLHFGIPILFPIHPRTQSFINKNKIRVGKAIRRIDPVGYLDFLQLLSATRLTLTDSGGIQEEACILAKPCVTLRDNTERPETVMSGGNILAGSNPAHILSASKSMLKKRLTKKNILGDGKASQHIYKDLLARARRKGS